MSLMLFFHAILCLNDTQVCKAVFSGQNWSDAILGSAQELFPDSIFEASSAASNSLLM